MLGCHRAPSSIDPELASCIPPGTLVLAGVDVDGLQSSPLAGALPALAGASRVLVAWNGKDMLLVSAGKSAGTPALTGSPDAVKAATAQHQTGKPGAPRLLQLASAIPAGRQVWVVARGGVALPLTGNAANLNRILALTESVTLSARVDAAVRVEAVMVGRSPEAAQQLEQSLRGILTLARLSGVEVRREDWTVRAGLTTTPETAEKLVRGLLP